MYQWITLQNTKWVNFLKGKNCVSVSTESFLDDPHSALSAILAICPLGDAEALIEAAVRNITESRAYDIGSEIKARLMRDHAATFAAIQKAHDHAL